jgi:hypothetical protein
VVTIHGNFAVTPVTTEQVDAILDRAEHGKLTPAEVNAVRNVLRALREMAKRAKSLQRDVYLQPNDAKLDEEAT